MRTLKKISSKFAINDQTINVIEKTLFLVSNWNPKQNGLGYSFGNGRKFMKLLSESSNLDDFSNDINCYLMSEPGLDVTAEIIDLTKSCAQFKLDLKNLIPFKLLNTDEMPKNTKLNSNECVKANEIIELFENCSKKINKGDVS
jgi:hypothetical protein